MPLAKTREKDRDRDADSPRKESKDSKDTKDRPRHKSSRSSRKVDKSSTPPERSSKPSSPSRTKPRRSSLPVPELERTDSNSPSGSKTRLPYPEFSKAHSKEAVGSRENVVTDQEKAVPKMHYFTPDPTDLSKEQEHGTKHEVRSGKVVAPPSPPETKLDEDIKVEKKKVEKVRFERKRTDLEKAADELKKKLSRESARTSEASKEKMSRESKPRRDSVKETDQEKTRSAQSPKTSKPGTPSRLKPKVAIVEDVVSSMSSQKHSSLRSGSGRSEATISTDSDATSIAPNQPNTQRPFTPVANRDSSPATEPDSPGPRTPIATDIALSRKETPAFSVNNSRAPSVLDESPMPPPPPPPPPLSEMPAPKVDYLIQNGGLPHAVSRSLLAAGIPTPPGQPPPAMNTQVELLFLPFNKLLDDYSKVFTRNGSLAVATGYRSVARRLLDRVERVFARDLSAETCLCDMCQQVSGTDQELDDKRSVSWGEILEYVCGRQDLPPWPPFSLVESVGLGISAAENATPMQKLDIDVPEEFREHYVRQSRKTKQSVDQWLQSQDTEASAPPQDFDDETLTFAMLTRLEPHQRPFFTSFLGLAPIPSRPASTAPLRSATPSLFPPQSTLLQKTSLALQRLYRLPAPPRDPESAMYLLTNPSIHNVLATLAAVSDHEWDLLISGRFDGFLRSGADDDNNSTPLPSTTPSNALPSSGPSRNQTSSTATNRNLATPSLPPSRGPNASTTSFNPNMRSSSSPSSAASGAPVALDEENEIAALAELERDIYLGMEALEDAFEALHTKAETVRRLLRERGAGLAQASQTRSNGNAAAMGAADVRLATPASNWDSETDDGIGDDSESLAPDDSASNVSRSRVRRPKRRSERRTPAPVEEEDEDEDENEVIRVVSSGSHAGGGRVSRGGDERAGMGRSGGSRLGKWFGGVS